MSTNNRDYDDAPRDEEEWVEWVNTCDDLDPGDPPELVRALRLARRLGDVSISQSEIETARVRVRARVFAAIAAQEQGLSAAEEIAEPCAGTGTGTVALRSSDDSAPVLADACARPRRSRAATPRRAPPRRVMYVAAAVLALGLTGLLAASHMAAASLPGSPLYGLKRGEEWLGLRTAWSDTRRGEVLGEIAHQRLGEAQAEAHKGDSAEVYALTGELDTTMRALIRLVAQMSRHHENTGSVAAALTHLLADERAALAQAQLQGQTVLAQSLTSAAQDQQQALTAANLTVPSTSPAVTPYSANPTPSPNQTGSGQQPTGSNGAGQGASGAAGSGSSGTTGAPGTAGQGGSQGTGPAGQPPGGASGTTTPPPPPPPPPRPIGPFGTRHMM